MQPYVGITGVVRDLDAKKLAPLAMHDSSHQLMVGYAMTPSSLRDNPIGPRYVALSSLPILLLYTKNAFNVIHYSTSNPGTLDDLTKALYFDEIYERELCRAVQFNTAVRPEEMIELKNSFSELHCILPIHVVPTWETWGPTLQQVRAYPADSFLLDESRGTGELFDVQQASDFYLALREVTDLPGGFAGGFTPENVRTRVRTLRKIVGEEFSIDVETGVRTNDQLDPAKAMRFVPEARRAFS